MPPPGAAWQRLGDIRAGDATKVPPVANRPKAAGSPALRRDEYRSRSWLQGREFLTHLKKGDRHLVTVLMGGFQRMFTIPFRLNRASSAAGLGGPGCDGGGGTGVVDHLVCDPDLGERGGALPPDPDAPGAFAEVAPGRRHSPSPGTSPPGSPRSH
jgi:hypothetical protein